MLKINDYVIYNLIGVCKIIDITEGKDIHDVDTEYYVLQPVCNSNLIIKCPVNGPKILIRKIISKNEALSLIETIPEKIKAEILKMIPLGKLGQPADVAKMVAFLAADTNKYITGQVISVDGGLTM